MVSEIVETNVSEVKSFCSAMEESLDPAEADESHTDFAANTDENYEEQGFLWMCAICENRPVFETIAGLFGHKKTRRHILEKNKKCGDSGWESNGLHAPHSPGNCEEHENYSDSPRSESDIARGDSEIRIETLSVVPPPSPTSSEDIPLSNLSARLQSLANKDRGAESENPVRSRKIKSACKRNKSSGVEQSQDCKENDESRDIENDNFLEAKEEEGDAINILSSGVINHEENSVKKEDADCAKIAGSDSGKAETKADENKRSDSSNVNESKQSESSKGEEVKVDENSTKPRVKHVCKICNSDFPSRVTLSVHKKTHLYKDTGCYKCEKCGKMCPKYDNFTRHLTIHFENREKTHECSHCLATFYNLADLKRHLVLHLSVKPFTCEHCGEGFTKEDSLMIHAAKHTGVQYTKYACKDCDKVLNSQSALVMHVKTHSVKTVFCPEPGCKFSCYLQSQLRQHVRKHSGEKPFQCAKCGRCFARSNDMKNHNLHVHEGVRRFKCPVCPKVFALLGNLRIHYTTHTNERPYLCAQCGKSFNHPSTLKKHSVMVHNPWRNENRGARSQKTASSDSSIKAEDVKHSEEPQKEVVLK